MAVSTNCRGCGTHLKIENGKANVAHETRFGGFPALKSAPPKKSLTSEKDSSQFAEKPLPANTTDTTSEAENFDTLVSEKKSDSEKNLERHFSPPRSLNNPSASTSLGGKILAAFGAGAKSPRDITCFDCGHCHQVSPLSSSSLCPKCGLYISLKNYDIRENWNQRIQTRGDVIVHSNGIVQSATIRCHNLTVNGIFNGGADCSGNFTIRNHGKILGRVSCRKLLVEKRAHVQFLNSIEAEEVVIDGVVIGNIQCKGKLSLLKKATLTGDIHVGSLTVAEGAKHSGQISMGW